MYRARFNCVGMKANIIYIYSFLMSAYGQVLKMLKHTYTQKSRFNDLNCQVWMAKRFGTFNFLIQVDFIIT